MAEENNDDVFLVEPPDDLESAVLALQDTMERFIDTASVDRVFGAPVRRGEYTLIPAAEVVAGLGFGIGFGGGEGPVTEDDRPTGEGSGGGGGGGGRTFARPVAVVIVGPEGVRVEPIVDPTKIALAALTAAGFVFATMSRMRRGRLTED